MGGDSLKCPFDISKLYCIPCDSSFKYDCTGANITGGVGTPCNGKYMSCACSSGREFSNGACACDNSCTVGAIYYSDGTCSACVDSNKTAVGVVVKDNELIIALKEAGNSWWSETTENHPNLVDYANVEAARTDFSGKQNTLSLVNSGASYLAANLCYNYAPNGMEETQGEWYLPALGELYLYVLENEKLQNSSSFLDMVPDPMYGTWTSTEYDSTRVWEVVGFQDGGVVDYYIKHSSFAGMPPTSLCFLQI